MTVVIDLRVSGHFSPAAAAFWEQFWTALAQSRFDEKFILILAEPAIEQPGAGNIECKVIRESSFKWLDRKSLLTFLREAGAGRYIAQHEFGFSVYRPSERLFQKKDIAAPAHVAAFSATLAKSWLNTNGISATITPLKPAHIIVRSNLSWTETESIKTRFTGGRDFFLFSGDIDEQHQLIELLKAFSMFKKWQQSNMQLVIAGYSNEWTDFFEDKLDSYKHKNDIVLLKDISEEDMAQLTASCYAGLYPCADTVMPFFITRAVQSGIPLICSATAPAKELTEVAEWINNANLQDEFAKAMILLYKDENHKNVLIEKEKANAANLDAGTMLEQSWQIITGC